MTQAARTTSSAAVVAPPLSARRVTETGLSAASAVVVPTRGGDDGKKGYAGCRSTNNVERGSGNELLEEPESFDLEHFRLTSDRELRP